MQIIDTKNLNSGKSITQINLPGYRRVSRLKSMMTQPRQRQQILSLEQQQLEIKRSFTKLANMINGLDNYFKSRIRIHQQQILKIVKIQLFRMQEDVQMIVSKYTDMINTKSKDQDIKHLRNEIIFYRTSLQKSQDEINELKRINKQLASKLQLKDQSLFENQEVMKKIKVKMLKQKIKAQFTRNTSVEKIPILVKSTKSQIINSCSPKVRSTQLQSEDKNHISYSDESHSQDLENLVKSSKNPKIKLTNLWKVSKAKQSQWYFLARSCNKQKDIELNN